MRLPIHCPECGVPMVLYEYKTDDGKRIERYSYTCGASFVDEY